MYLPYSIILKGKSSPDNALAAADSVAYIGVHAEGAVVGLPMRAVRTRVDSQAEGPRTARLSAVQDALLE